MMSIIRECYAVGSAKGVRLEPATADEFIHRMLSKLIPSTAAHYPSMLQDLKQNKRIEIDAINGAIFHLGNECGIPTPSNERVIHRLKELVKFPAKVL
jgi:2-dehydropantoate 2-reductase